MKSNPGSRVLLTLLAILIIGWQILPRDLFAAEWNLQTLMRDLGSRTTGQARFSEKKYLSVLDTPIEQSGTLAFAPGQLEKHTLQPNQERMIVDGGTLVIETGTNGKVRRLRLQSYPVVWGFVEGMRATLTGDLDTLQRFYEIELHGTREDWELVMVPSQRDMSVVVRLMSIRGESDRINVIEVVQVSGDRSVMRIDEKTP